MKEETEFMKSILPSHYTCEPRDNGVHCYSEIGIQKGKDAEDDEHWEYIMKAIRQKFSDRFMEVYHKTCTNHVKFTVYIKN